LVVFGTIYATVQQSQRNNANSPQIQISQDAAADLNGGDSPLVLLGRNVDMKTSLAPFIIIYDKAGNVVNGSGYLNGKIPKAPIGVLTDSKGKDYNAVTWEPQDGVHVASVTVAAKNYYVLSGRSLTEVEKNETKSLQITLLGALAALILLGVIFVLNDIRSESNY